MRKALLFLLMLLALLLCACTRETHPSVYEVEQNGRVYTVDRENGVLTCGGQTYQYCVDKDGSIEILYPDGATFWWTVRGNTGFGGWSDDYTERERVPGEELLEVLGHDTPLFREWRRRRRKCPVCPGGAWIRHMGPGGSLFGLVCGAVSGCEAVRPCADGRTGWRYCADCGWTDRVFFLKEYLS